MWYFESLYPDIKLGLKAKLFYRKKTLYQDLRIYRNPRFGRALVLDGALQTTERDEFIYHEMLVHAALFIHPAPRKVLIIGGGDGGALREVLKHKTVVKVTLVEIDKDVIEISQKFLKSICKNSFQDKRTNLVIGDGAKFVRASKEKFDVVIIDSPDPLGPARVLFTEKFYKNVFCLLNKEGVLIRQTGSTILQAAELRQNYKTLNKVFPFVWLHLAAIPTYIGGFFSFSVASKRISLKKINHQKLSKKVRSLGIKTKYYSASLHLASATLPEYVRKIVG